MRNFEKIPAHVSMIMDGNGRWAKNQGKERIDGHKEGVESVRACIEYAAEQGINYLSLFAFSEENWARPQAEVSFLMALMVKSLLNEMPLFMKNNIKLLVKGNRARLSDELNKTIIDCEEKTHSNSRLTLVIFLSYSGKWDVVQAAKRAAEEIMQKGDEFNESDFSKYLITSDIPDPDLIIRTSGEKRLSNYLLWQGAYSELYFTDILWPDFKREEFENALISFEKRDRRYGKVK